MVAPPRSWLQSVLQTAVQSVDWTYSLLWQRCPQRGQGILVWSDGYYNGTINTRKTVEPTEVTTEEAALQRSQELRQLYESLVSTESNHQSRRPSATLSPEDLTESEWFYLLSVSFSFRPGFGLPGRAYEKQKHVWLAGADQIDSKISCPRLILARSAGIKTCVCIPILDGVVELGTIKLVEEDIGFIQDIKSLFSDHSKPVISDHSTSHTPSISFRPLLVHPTVVLSHDSALPMDDSHVAQDVDDDESESESESEGLPMPGCEEAEASDHQQLVEKLDVPVGVRAWLPSASLDQEPCHPLDVLEGISPPKEDNVYSRTVPTILQSTRWPDSSSAATSSAATAFSKYSTSTSHHHRQRHRHCDSSQSALKYILFTVPFLHTHSQKPTSNNSSDRLRRDSASVTQEDLGGSHVLSERRRREKLNERFVTLRSLVPFVTKMDKASILGDTIEYLKHLCEKIQELEDQTRKTEAKVKQMKLKILTGKGDSYTVLSPRKKKKRKITGDGGERKNAAAQVEVSIIESDALVEIKCLHKEGLLIDVIQMLRKFMIEVIAVQSSMENGVFATELRAKVGREGINGRKASIMEVKREIKRIIYSIT